MSVLYERIKECCESLGITGYRLCKDCSVSPSVITDLSKGRKKTLSGDYLVRFANRLGVTPDYLLGNTDKKESAQPDEELDAELMNLMREANEQEETREMLQNLMQRSDLRALLHATKNATPEQIDAVTEMLLRFKGRNQYD